MVALVVQMLLQEEVIVVHHGMAVRQVTNTTEGTLVATVEALTVQALQMIHIMLVHVEMVVQKAVLTLQVTPTIVHLVDITTHVLREQVVHLKVVGQVVVEIRQEVHLLLQTQAIQEVHLHNHLVGAIAEAVAQVLMVVVVAAVVVAQAAAVAAEVAVGQDN